MNLQLLLEIPEFVLLSVFKSLKCRCKMCITPGFEGKNYTHDDSGNNKLINVKLYIVTSSATCYTHSWPRKCPREPGD